MVIRVQRYEGQVEQRPLRAPRLDERAPQGGENIGPALNRAAAVVAGVQQQERDRADQTALLEADTALDGWETENVLDAENGALTKKGKEAFDISNQVLPNFDAEAKRIEEGLGSDRAKGAFRAQVNRRRGQMASTLERHEFAERNAFYDEQDSAKIASSSQMAGNYYNDPERIGSELAKQDAVVDSFAKRKGWSPEQIAEEKRKNHSNVHSDVVSRYLAKGDYRMGRVYFDEVKSQIGADMATRLEAQFTAERDRVKTEVKQAMNDQLRDITAAAAAGLPVSVPSEAVLKGIYGAHEGGQRFKIAKQAQDLSPKVAQMKLMSKDELTSFVSSAKPTAQEGAADQAQTAAFLNQRAEAILREREEDPAGYIVASSPKAQEAWTDFTTARDQDGHDIAAANYLRTVRAERERLQITKNDILPDAYADQVADQLNFPKSAEGLASDIEAQATRWGSAWPEVYEQLAPKLSDTTAVIASGIPRSAAVALASIADLKPDEVKKLVPADQWKELESGVAGKLEDFTRSLPPSAARTSNAFRESVTRLAARYTQHSDSTSDAVDRAYRDLIGKKYQMVEFHGVPMRIPNQVPDHTAEDGARAALAGYEATGLDVVDRGNSFVQPEELAGDFTAYVRENGYWITNASESGVQLYVDGGPVTRAGSPVHVTWDKLAALGAAEAQRDTNAALSRSK